MPETGLQDLLDRYRRARDDAAMAELVRLTRPRLLRVARRIVPSDLAEDCVQLAYLSLVRDRGEDFRPKVLPWLIAATVRIAYAAKAKEQRQRDLARRLEHATATSHEVDVGRDDLAALVRARVASLPAAYRDAVVLHHLEGLSVRESASLLDLSVEATKKRLQRGRALLRARLHPRLIAPVLLPLWWFADAPVLAQRAGGIFMKKKAAMAGILVLLAILIGAGSSFLDSSAPTRAEAMRGGSTPLKTARGDADPSSQKRKRNLDQFFTGLQVAGTSPNSRQLHQLLEETLEKE